MKSKTTSVSVVITLLVSSIPGALAQDQAGSPVRSASWNNGSISLKGMSVSNSSGQDSNSLGADYAFRLQRTQMDPTEALHYVVHEDGGAGLYYTRTNAASGNTIGDQRDVASMDININTNVALLPGSMYSHDCGIFLTPGIEAAGRVNMATSLNATGDFLKAAATLGTGYGCILNNGATIMLGLIGKGQAGASTYGDTHGTAAGIKLAIDAQRLFFNLEGTSTVSGIEDGGNENRWSGALGYRTTNNKIEGGVEMNHGSIYNRDTGKDASNSAMGPSVQTNEVKARIAIAW